MFKQTGCGLFAGLAFTFAISCGMPVLAANLFNASFTLGDHGDGYLSIHTTIPHQTYENAGILVTSSNYHISENNGACTMNPTNSWCLFTTSDALTRNIRIKRMASIRTPLLAAADSVTIKLALNAVDTPLSEQELSLSAQQLETTQPPGRVIGYLYGWEAPPSAAGIAGAGYSHVLIAFGLFSTTSPGTINIQSISGFDLATEVNLLHQNGLKVLLSIGGASTNISNTTVDFDSAVQLASTPAVFEQNFINSMTLLVNTYGFDGFDFDIESGLNGANSFTNPNQGCSNSTYNSACDISYLSYIINTFHSQSPNSLLTMAPQIANIAATSGFNATWGNYASLIMQTYASLEWVGFQNYNSGCAYGINLVCYPTGSNTLTSTPDSAVAFATDLLANWPATLSTGQPTGFQPYISYLTPSQVVIGYVVNNNAGTSDGSPAAITSVIQNVIPCLTKGQNCDTYTPPTTYPGFGGVFSWTINYDASNNYQFATSVYPCLVNGVCVNP